ncbi:MAG: hypothetical protein Q8S29_11530 [Phreatobacter sp.]|nr:hypothetical protein [Phreatobacter sp.]
MPPSRNRSAPETAAAAAPATLSTAPMRAAVPASPTVSPLPSGGPAAGANPELPHTGQPCTGLAACPERPHLVRRLFAAAEREITAMEASLGGTSATAARRLGALAAALDRLTVLDRKTLAAARDAATGDADVPPVAAPVDADAWAEALAAQLDSGKSGEDRGPVA